MHNSIFLSVLLAFLMKAPLSTGQVSTTTASPPSTISPPALTTLFVPTSTPLPTSSQSPDPWQCATRNLTQYFDVPRPSAVLLSALESYGDKLIKPCLSTATGLNKLSCSVSETTQWCGFTTDATPPMKTRYSAYGSSAASWYSAKSAAIQSVRGDCPVTWEKFGPLDHAWLNQTIAHAKCYDGAYPRENSSAVSASSTSKGG
ncbi:hypothetical protein P153DRAFT_393589 [Dothidotthia symphoricarpi CBS 119687]|uniref:DUF7735 domain-containing protein n=1 Tax=Dothidotthia symphoricarpi CBS 119687 TaxID=1392245 RepID=A0A6A6AN95_9PLEO|nr:uncharacterized protein P153DRAFT_393589 [Dothidotthia symphoricarpi CBS 119687]KAF2132618.1 hypothetical protein P153DRAFT_393589 [Dothidotthia symphoricarpi CBS 119687]